MQPARQREAVGAGDGGPATLRRDARPGRCASGFISAGHRGGPGHAGGTAARGRTQATAGKTAGGGRRCHAGGRRHEWRREDRRERACAGNARLQERRRDHLHRPRDHHRGEAGCHHGDRRRAGRRDEPRSANQDRRDPAQCRACRHLPEARLADEGARRLGPARRRRGGRRVPGGRRERHRWQLRHAWRAGVLRCGHRPRGGAAGGAANLRARRRARDQPRRRGASGGQGSVRGTRRARVGERVLHATPVGGCRSHHRHQGSVGRCVHGGRGAGRHLPRGQRAHLLLAHAARRCR